jgi:plastocyanin domain-containing protein
MRLPAVLALASALALTACEKKESGSSGKTTADVKTGEVGPDGVRRIAIEAGKGGYKPSRIEARPGESLILVFTRTAEGECLSQIKVADGEVKELPMNQPVEIPVTAPKSGEIAFACGMDMFSGVIAVN